MGMTAERDSRVLPADAANETAAAFDELYEQFAPFVWRTLRGFGVAREELDDAVQDVFVIVHQRLGQFEGRSSLRTWICSITLGVARNAYRKTKRRDAAVATMPPMAPTEAAAGRLEAIDLVNRLLAELDEDQRLVFILAELERLTAPEISETLKVNVNTVYSRLRLARAAFDAALERHGGRP